MEEREMSEIPRRIGARDLVPRPDLLADVKLIGLGGVGGPAARYGALYLAGLDEDVRMVLVDGDSFEPSNATRMFFGGDGNKAEVVREDLLGYLGEGRLTLDAIGEYVTPENIGDLIREGDIVLLAVDNHATRKLVSDFCATSREDICLVSAGNDGIGKDSSGRELRGTAGNCQIYIRRDGADVTPALTRFHAEIDNPADALPDDTGCTELLESVPQIVFANLTAAASMLNTLWLYLCGALHYPEVAFDIAEGLMRPIRLPLPEPRAGNGRPPAAA
jgi:molybdopterin/thiamine biosynthesis adenylyltransferase